MYASHVLHELIKMGCWMWTACLRGQEPKFEWVMNLSDILASEFEADFGELLHY